MSKKKKVGQSSSCSWAIRIVCPAFFPSELRDYTNEQCFSMKEGKRKKKKKRKKVNWNIKTRTGHPLVPSEGRASQFLIPLYADGAAYDLYRSIKITRHIKDIREDRTRKEITINGEKKYTHSYFFLNERAEVTRTNVVNNIYIYISICNIIMQYNIII